MKPNALFMLAFGTALASVEAAPLRLLVVTNNNQEVSQNIRFGHAVPNANMNNGHFIPSVMAGPGAKIESRRPCIMKKMHNKAIQMFNSFRAAMGLPMIDAPVLHTGNGHSKGDDSEPILHILPFIGTPPTFVEVKGSDSDGFIATTQGGEPVQVITPGQPLPHPDHRHKPHHHHKHKPHNFKMCRNSPFVRRLGFALMSLGPWEGRAVAFVLGCGIGVLLRMFWVFSVIVFRAVKGRKSEITEYTIIHEYIDEEEPTTLPPPTYAYVDEKVDEKTSDAKKNPEENVNA